MKRAGQIVGVLVLIGAIVFFLTDEPPPPRQYPFAFAATIPAPADLTVGNQEGRDLPFVGAGAADFDGDGTPELFIGGAEGRPDRLFRFQGPALMEVTANSGVDQPKPGSTHGFTPVDVDGDGDLDFYLARSDGVLLFTNETPQVTIGAAPQPLRFTLSRPQLTLPADAVPIGVAVGDFNRNRVPDLLVAAWPRAAASEDDPLVDAPAPGGGAFLFIDSQTAEGVIYSDASVATGLSQGKTPTGGAIADLDGDHLPDLVVTYQDGTGQALRNQGNLTFTPAALPPVPMAHIGAMTLGDVDNDGRLDVILGGPGEARIDSDISAGDATDWTVLRNNGDFTFTDLGQALNLRSEARATSLAAGDFDGNGNIDVLAGTAGRGWELLAWQPPIGGPYQATHYSDPAALAEAQADGVGRYRIEPGTGLPTEAYGMGTVVFDFGNDGADDAVLIPREGPVTILARPKPAAIPGFVKVALHHTADATGSQVTLTLPPALGLMRPPGMIVSRQLVSYAVGANVSLPLTLGIDTAEVTELVVEWANSTRRRVLPTPQINALVDMR